MRPHSLAALVLGNFRFPSFLERAHSDFQSRKLRFNHLIRCTATAIGRDILFTVRQSARSNEANDAGTGFWLDVFVKISPVESETISNPHERQRPVESATSPALPTIDLSHRGTEQIKMLRSVSGSA